MQIIYELSWLWTLLGIALAAAAVCRALDGTNYLLTAAACGLTEDELAEIWRVQKEETE